MKISKIITTGVACMAIAALALFTMSPAWAQLGTSNALAEMDAIAGTMSNHTENLNDCTALVQCTKKETVSPSGGTSPCYDKIKAACKSTGCTYVMRDDGSAGGTWDTPQLCSAYSPPPTVSPPAAKPPVVEVKPDRHPKRRPGPRRNGRRP